MAITRKYETKEECVSLFIDEEFDGFPSWVVTEQDDWYERWYFKGLMDSEDVEYNGEGEVEDFGLTHEPMWNTLFIPNWWVREFTELNPETVAECGFTLIYCDDCLFALGIDGAGYSFRDAHFARLYDAMGIHWHE